MVEFKIRDAIATPTIARSVKFISSSLVQRQLSFCCDRDQQSTNGQQADNDSEPGKDLRIPANLSLAHWPGSTAMPELSPSTTSVQRITTSTARVDVDKPRHVKGRGVVAEIRKPINAGHNEECDSSALPIEQPSQPIHQPIILFCPQILRDNTHRQSNPQWRNAAG